MGVHVVDETKGSMTCEKYRSSSSSSLSPSRIIGAPMRSWKSRSKSQSRIAVESRCQWTPEAQGRWRNSRGHLVVLSDTPLLHVSEGERLALQRLAINRLQEVNLGCSLDIPKSENIHFQQTKKRIMLLRKKAVTTAFLDSKEKIKGSNAPSAVFGVPLTQCIAGDKFRTSTGRNAEEQKDHCEEVLSALRISPGRSSLDDVRVLSSINIRSGESLLDVSSGELQVPLVVQTCLQFLEGRGVQTLGIFRVSGSQKRVRQLREDLDSNLTSSFGDTTQPHDVAQLLKEYFRDLPEPLLVRSLYRPFLTAQRIPDQQRKLKAVRWLLYLLPVAHRDTLATLLAFLHKVSQFSEASDGGDGMWVEGNKMDINNLATVFGPNLLRMSKGSTDSPYAVHSAQRAQERSDVILTIRMLIECHKDLFTVPVDDLDPVYQQLMTDEPDLLNDIFTKLLDNSRNSDRLQDSSGTTFSDDGFMVTSKDKTSHVSHEFTENTEKRIERIVDWNVRSRIRPLMVEKESEKTDALMSSPHLPERVTETYGIGSRRSSGTSSVNQPAFQPFAVTASFTITMAGKGNQCVSGILPQNIRDCETSSKSRRVPYGKLRHMTSPAYVTEETITTITIPPPRNISVVKGDSGSYKSIYDRVSPWDSGKIKTEADSPKLRQSVERQGRARTKVVEQVLLTSNPVVPERWKRQEIIASEHIQH